MSGEPLDYHLADRNSGNLRADSVGCETEAGHDYLGTIGSDAERKGHGALDVMAYSPPLDEGAAEHQAGAHYAGETYAELVKYDSAEEEQKQEHVEETV